MALNSPVLSVYWVTIGSTNTGCNHLRDPMQGLPSWVFPEFPTQRLHEHDKWLFHATNFRVICYAALDKPSNHFLYCSSFNLNTSLAVCYYCQQCIDITNNFSWHNGQFPALILFKFSVVFSRVAILYLCSLQYLFSSYFQFSFLGFHWVFFIFCLQPTCSYVSVFKHWTTFLYLLISLVMSPRSIL